MPDTPLGAPDPAAETCFHCGLPVPEGLDLHVDYEGHARPMCCRGCQAVARAILDYGLGDYYRFRTETAPTAEELVPDVLRQAQVFDEPDIQRHFVRRLGADEREASLILEGIVCPACVWVNERHLQGLPGVLGVQVNFATRRAQVRWDNRRIQLSRILTAIREVGYAAYPYDPQSQQNLLERERKRMLRQLGLAALMSSQVMMLSVAVYVGDYRGIEDEFRRLFNWVMLGLTLPVVLYSAQAFFGPAWRDLQRLKVGMDVPVSLGIILAFLGSIWATVVEHGHVYYDSVTMFVFFLLIGRYLEFAARKRATEASDVLVRLTPATACRLRDDGDGIREERVPVVQLRPGDRILVRPGEAVPADGSILEGRSTVDEALLTGESLPQPRAAGDRVVGGSINVESPLQVRVEQVGPDTVLSQILRLLERAQSGKPAVALLSEKAATWFVVGVLLLASAVAAHWWQVDPGRWLPITLSVLVVTCPCALALATPAAITAATGALMRLGLLTTRGHAIETLARVTHVVFDKTGTLTQGRLRLAALRPLGSLSNDELLRLAAGLELQSEHPIARALRAVGPREGLPRFHAVQNLPGEGLSGELEGRRYLLGTPDFVARSAGIELPGRALADLQTEGGTLVLLADGGRALGAFVFEDALRPGARELMDHLKSRGKTVILMTGDQPAAARRVGAALGIDDLRAGLKPDDKLRQVEALQRQGAVVAMVGDGINDAPVLAGAQVSVAMGEGTQAASASADLILMNSRLAHLAAGLDTAGRTLQIVRQNILWAVSYNLLALPAAAAGLVAPWMAAIGMSLSSLLVVGNALRLVPRSTASTAGAGTERLAGAAAPVAAASRGD